MEWCDGEKKSNGNFKKMFSCFGKTWKKQNNYWYASFFFYFIYTRTIFIYNDFSSWHIIFILDNHFPSWVFFIFCLRFWSALWKINTRETMDLANNVPHGWQFYHIPISEKLAKHPNARGGFMQESVQFVLKNNGLVKALTFGQN